MRKVLLGLTMLMMACGSGGGGGGAAAPATGLGISVVSNKIVDSYAPDLCSQFAGETCYFNGGQRVKFDDGSVLLTGNFIFIYINGGDTDSDQVGRDVFFPSTITTGYLKLSAAVARGAGYKSLYLVWTRSPETLSLVADTTGNNSPLDGGDETISAITMSDW